MFAFILAQSRDFSRIFKIRVCVNDFFTQKLVVLNEVEGCIAKYCLLKMYPLVGTCRLCLLFSWDSQLHILTFYLLPLLLLITIFWTIFDPVIFDNWFEGRSAFLGCWLMIGQTVWIYHLVQSRYQWK